MLRLLNVGGIIAAVGPPVYAPSDDTFMMLDAIERTIPRCARRRLALDMGCGCGVLTVALARNFRRVIAVDIDPRALRLAALTAHLNGVRRRVRFVLSDLFENLDVRGFDLIVFNAPYLPGRPSSAEEVALLSGFDLYDRFLRGARKALSEGGRVLMTASEPGWLRPALERARALGFNAKISARRRFLAETLAVIELWLPASTSG